MQNYEIYITDKCNMSCSYCYMRNQKITNFQKTLELIDKIDDNEEFILEFLGGEPLLYPEKIEEICERFKNKKAIYILTTNGTLMNDYIYSIISRYKIRTFFSIDGDYECFNKNRKISVDGFNQIVDNFKKYNFTNVHVTFDNITLKKFDDTLNFLIKIGAKLITFGFVSKSMSNSDYYYYSNKIIEKLDYCIKNNIFISPVMDYRNEKLDRHSNRIENDIYIYDNLKENIEGMLNKYYISKYCLMNKGGNNEI